MNEREMVELSEFVALRHEARPTREDTEIYLKERLRKPHGGWWEIARHSGKPVDDINSFYWRPAYSIDSPQLAMRLLKELLAMGFQVSKYGVGRAASDRWTDDAIQSGDLNTPLELSLACAYKKAVESK